MTVNERLVSYLSNRRVASCDSRWEDLLNDTRAGYIRLDDVPGEEWARIVMLNTPDQPVYAEESHVLPTHWWYLRRDAWMAHG